MAADQRSRLQWLCRRGTREMDLLLQHFLDKQYEDLQAVERQALFELLSCPDQELLAWISGRALPSDPQAVALIEKMRLCSQDLKQVLPRSPHPAHG